jgi:hypothetical protein
METIERIREAEFEGEDARSSNLAETATITEQRPEAEIRAAIADVVRRSDRDLADDLIIALRVRERAAEDTGERIALVDFVRLEGFDPADLDLE